MVGQVKRSSLFKFTELNEILLDVEVALNNWPLSFVEDDIQMPLTTPESMMRPSPTCHQNWNRTTEEQSTSNTCNLNRWSVVLWRC